MPRFSANLGFLWTELALPDAIRAAASAGFDAVECHWPFDVDPALVRAALADTDLPMLGLNTRRGDVQAGDNGLAAIPGREAEAHDAIEEAITYAAAIGAGSVHVMAGIADGSDAHDTFVSNLGHATRVGAEHGLTILIEALNPHDAPGYFLNSTEQASEIIGAVGAPNLKLMFDCYHVGRSEGDVIERLHAVYPLVGHIQFAAVPDRGEPGHGDVDYSSVFAEIDRLGWDQPLGAEYRPSGETADSLSWMTFSL